MRLIRAIQPKTWLVVAKGFLACMFVMVFLVDDAQQMLTVAGVTFGLVGACFGLACYSYRAAQQAAAADEPRPKQGRQSKPSPAARG